MCKLFHSIFEIKGLSVVYSAYKTGTNTHARTHAHTHLTALFPGVPG